MHLVGGCDSHPRGAANQGKTKESYDDGSCELCHFGNEKPVRNELCIVIYESRRGLRSEHLVTPIGRRYEAIGPCGNLIW
jgi:hypothetical protein